MHSTKISEIEDAMTQRVERFVPEIERDSRFGRAKDQIKQSKNVYGVRKGSLTPIKQFTASKESLSATNINASKNSKSNATTVYNDFNGNSQAPLKARDEILVDDELEDDHGKLKHYDETQTNPSITIKLQNQQMN